MAWWASVKADAPARVVRELVEMADLFAWSRGLRSIVVGLDPFEPVANHARVLYETQSRGRRGLGVHASARSTWRCTTSLASRSEGRRISCSAPARRCSTRTQRFDRESPYERTIGEADSTS